LARGFYYEANGIALDEALIIEDSIRARHYEGDGMQLAWQFESATTNQWSVRPAITWLHLYRLLWGEVSGTLNYTDADNWGGNLYVDYAYTEDKLPPVRWMDEPSYGDLYSFDLSFHWAWQRYQLAYQGWNLLARIDWQDTPVTFGTKNWQFTDGNLGSDADFPIYQREGEVFRTMRPPKYQRVQQTLMLSPELDLTLHSNFNGIRNGHELGLAWQPASVIWQAGFDIEQQAVRLGLLHRWGKLSVLSDSFDINNSQLVAIQAGLNLTF